MFAEAGGKRRVFEISSADVVVERGRVARKICFYDVEFSIEIVISRGNAHARLGFAVRAQRAPRFHGHVGESAVLLVLIKRAGRRIVRDVNIRPAVVVEIGSEHAKSERSVGLENSGALGNIRKCAVAVVVEQNIFSAEKSRRSASDENSFVFARAGFGDGRGRQIEIDVVCDEKIEVAVAIVIDESAAGVPPFAVGGDAGFLRNVGERPVSVVVVQNIFTERSDVNIVEAVVVVIADANALSPSVVNES